MEIAARKQIFWLQASLLLWAGASLSFMAAMSISGVLFVLTSLICLKAGINLKSELLRSAYWKFTLAFMCIATLSLIYSRLVPPLGIHFEGFGEVKKFLYYLQPIVVAWALLSISQAQNRKIEESPLWRVIFWLTLIVSLTGIFQFWAGDILGQEFVRNGGRFFRVVAQSSHSHAQGFMFFHLSFASAMSFSFCYALARFIFKPLYDDRRANMLWGILALLSGLAVFYSYSRISWLALVAVTILLAFLRKPKWSLMTAMSLLVAGSIYWSLSADLRARFMSFPGWRDRLVVWMSSIEMFKDRPILGVGFAKSGHFSDAYAVRFFKTQQDFASHAHNNYLDILATTGALGFFAFCAFWFALVYYAILAYRRAKRTDRWLPAALLAGALAFHINGLTQVNFFDAKSQHSLVLWTGLVLALHWRNLRADQGLTEEAKV